MFRWLLKPRFYSKCLSYVKFMKIRLETLQNRKKSVLKFMKSDIAELLRSGLDYDAYRRAEVLLLEQNMLSCYELIEKFTGSISDHVEDITKQKECPDECKEAVPSLIYAAARIADLPELRELRTIFTEKFGNSLEPYINREFVDKLRRAQPTREMKIQLLYDIAQEFSLEWDDKALRQRLYTLTSSLEERPKPGGEHTEGRDINTSEGKERNSLPFGRKDLNDDSWMHQSSSDDETSTDTSSHDGRKGGSSSLGSVSEDDEVEIKRPISYWLIPPPYLKQNTYKGESNIKKTTDSETILKQEPNEPVAQEKTTPKSARKIHLNLKPVQGQDSVSGSKTYDVGTPDSGGMMKSGKGKAFTSEQEKCESAQNRRRTTSHVRGTSLPNELTNELETSKGHIRTISLESGIRGSARHVHPKLPDYDDLKTYLESLRRR
ncbi:hypothetical protein RJT34_17070 [Clitoria ternatea]|uniref:Uncharacterized protein n=1 Tax=Clitoria ternatea TaxID=43366 RepID=A0AAN9PCT3_CLITE